MSINVTKCPRCNQMRHLLLTCSICDVCIDCHPPVQDETGKSLPPCSGKTHHRVTALNMVATVECPSCLKEFTVESKNHLSETYPISPLELIEECDHCGYCAETICEDQHGNIIYKDGQYPLPVSLRGETP